MVLVVGGDGTDGLAVSAGSGEAPAEVTVAFAHIKSSYKGGHAGGHHCAGVMVDTEGGVKCTYYSYFYPSGF